MRIKTYGVTESVTPPLSHSFRETRGSKEKEEKLDRLDKKQDFWTL